MNLIFIFNTISYSHEYLKVWYCFFNFAQLFRNLDDDRDMELTQVQIREFVQKIIPDICENSLDAFIHTLPFSNTYPTGVAPVFFQHLRVVYRQFVQRILVSLYFTGLSMVIYYFIYLLFFWYAVFVFVFSFFFKKKWRALTVALKYLDLYRVVQFHWKIPIHPR